MPRTTHYDNLGLPPSASIAEVKSAFRKLSLLHHPDKLVGKDLSSEQLDNHKAVFLKANLAYEVLADPAKKAKYDEKIEAGDYDDDSETDEDSEDEEFNAEFEPDFMRTRNILTYSTTFWILQLQVRGSCSLKLVHANAETFEGSPNQIQIEIDIDFPFNAEPSSLLCLDLLIKATPGSRPVESVSTRLVGYTMSIFILLADQDPRYPHYELKISNMVVGSSREFAFRPWSYVEKEE